MKKSSFGTLNFMKTSQSLGFGHFFAQALSFFGEILPSLAFALTTHPYLHLLGSHPPPGDIMSTLGGYHDCFGWDIMGTFLGVEQIGVFNINF